jgi:hypothetical protein
VATPPVFIADNEGTAGWDSTTTPKTTAAFSAAVGEAWVTGVICDIHNRTIGVPTNTGTAQTFTAQGFVESTDYCEVRTFSTVVSAALTSQTVSTTLTGGGLDRFNLNVVRFSGSDGIGAVPAGEAETASTAPSLDITTTAANSAIVVFCADWNAADGASRTWRTVNSITPTSGNGYELTYFRNSSQYTVYIGYYPDAGAAGVKTVGLSAPTTMKASIVAVEVKGTSAVDGRFPTPPVALPFVGPGMRPTARPFQLRGDASGSESKALDDTGAGDDTATIEAAAPLTDTAAGDDTATVAAAVPLADTAAGDDASDLAVVASVALAETGTGDDSLNVQVQESISQNQALPLIPGMLLAWRTSAAQNQGDAETPLGNQVVALDDAGAAADSVTATAAVPLADTGAVSDDLAVAVAFTIADTAAAADSLSASVGTGIDSYQASPALAWMFTSPRAASTQNIGDTTSGPVIPDTATGTDALTLAVAVPLTETAAGTDIAAVAVSVTLAETASAADLVSPAVGAPLGDTAAADDSLSVQVVGGSDPHQAVPQHKWGITRPGVAMDPPALQLLGDASGSTLVSLPDNATATDDLIISVAVPMAETAAGADALAAAIAPPLSELVSAADELAIAVVLALAETASAADNLHVGGSGVQGNVYPRPDSGATGSGRPRITGSVIGAVT